MYGNEANEGSHSHISASFEEIDDKYQFNMLSPKIEIEYCEIETTIKEEMDDSKLPLSNTLSVKEQNEHKEGEDSGFYTSGFQGKYSK